jgi:tetratricopeptide (TPR) repeat protein
MNHGLRIQKPATDYFCFTILLLGLLLTVACSRKTPDELLDEANQLYQQKDVLSASLKYEDLLKQHPDSKEAAKAHIGLAMCSMMDKDFEKARDQFSAAIKAFGGVGTPDGFRSELMRLNSYVQENQPLKALSEALKTSDTLRGAPPEARDAFQLNLLELYMLNKKEDQATSLCLVLLDKGPSEMNRHMPVLEKLGQMSAVKKDFAGAAKVYQNYLDKYPDTPMRGIMLFGMAFYQKQGGLAAEAEKTLDLTEQQIKSDVSKALGANEKVQALQQLAKVQQFRARQDDARKTLEQILDKDKFPLPEQRQAAQMSIVDLEMGRNQPRQAIAVLETMIKENPNSQVSAGAQQMIQKINADLQSSGTLQRKTTGTQERTTGAAQTTATTPAQPAPAAGDSATTKSSQP